MDLISFGIGVAAGAAAGTVITSITQGLSRKKALAENLDWVQRELVEIKDKAKGYFGGTNPPPSTPTA